MKNNTKRTMLTLIIMIVLITTGCNKSDFKADFMNAPLGTYINKHDDISKFVNIYEAWKYDIDTLYVQAGIDEYTNSYLLEKMPYVFSTIINASNEYDMNVYALLDSNIWITKSNEDSISKEIINILSYNKKTKDKKFKGININVDLTSTNKNELNNYYENLKETRSLIDLHNKYNEDNLKLSIELNSEIIKDIDYVDKILNLVDKVIIASPVEDILENGDNILSIVDKYEDKKVDIIIDYNNEDIFNLKPIKLSNKVDKLYAKFNKHKSFNGFIISNHEKYISYVKKMRP